MNLELLNFSMFSYSLPKLAVSSLYQLSIKLHVVKRLKKIIRQQVAFKEFSISPRSFLFCNFFIGVLMRIISLIYDQAQDDLFHA
jgi:hypothetical protein